MSSLVPSIFNEVIAAEKRIRPYILKTPLIRSDHLSDAVQGEVYLKLESEQYTGSFKARGSLNKLMYLSETKDERFPITASTGNHGMGFARGLQLLGMSGKVIIPTNTVSSKVGALNSLGAKIELHGSDSLAAELHAKEAGSRTGAIYVSPYNDRQVIGGQGTVAIEMLEQSDGIVDNLFVTIGGGGLISGVGAYVKEIDPSVHLFGCMPEASPEMALSVRSGKYLTVEQTPTLSDASAGGFEKDSITFPICKKVVDDFVIIPEKEISACIRLILEKERKLIEGAAAVAVGSLLRERERLKGQTSIVLICGGNISPDKLRMVLNEPGDNG